MQLRLTAMLALAVLAVGATAFAEAGFESTGMSTGVRVELDNALVPGRRLLQQDTNTAEIRMAPPQVVNSAPDYKVDDSLIVKFNTLRSNATGVSMQGVLPGLDYFYGWARVDMAGIDYATTQYNPGTYMRARKAYICHLNPESWSSPRTVGVTWFEDRDYTRFKRCYYVAKDWNTGRLTMMTESDPARWATLMMPKDTDGNWPVEWMASGPVIDSCWKARTNQNGGFGCPAFVGNYGEDNSPIGINPERFICRYLQKEDDNKKFYAYGWTDAKKTGANSYEGNSCIAFVMGPGGLPAYTEEHRGAFDIMVFSQKTWDLKTKLEPRALSCGPSCRATENFPYPQGYWPGLYANDIVEGVYSIAFDLASCCQTCQRTFGCYAYVWFGKNFNWCWMKTTNCFNQQSYPGSQPGSPQKAVCFDPPKADLNQCPLSGATSATYNAILPAENRAKFDSGSTCKVTVYKENHDLANCPTDLLVYAETPADCCRACQEYNAITDDRSRWCSSWTLYKVEKTCYLRKGACNWNGGVINLSVVSAALDTTPSNLLPPWRRG